MFYYICSLTPCHKENQQASNWNIILKQFAKKYSHGVQTDASIKKYNYKKNQEITLYQLKFSTG